MDLPKRKNNRLKDYDYSSAGAYFITVCTEKRKCLLWSDVGATCGRPSETALSSYGKTVRKHIVKLSDTYENVSVDKYVVMPNHIHLIIIILPDENGRPQVAPTVSRAVKQFKGAVTKEIGCSIWQKGFYDHVIRSEREYYSIVEYIRENVVKWDLDCYF